MPTMITVPIGQRTKSIQFGAAYSPSLSFNPDKELLSGCSGILSGLGLTVNTVPNPDQVTVAAGAFIQRGIIVEVSSAQVVEVPDPTVYPLYLVAENANEVHNSSVQYIFTTTPAADSVIIAEWAAAPITAPTIPIHISLCGLKEAIEAINALIIQRERIVAVAAQTVFTLPGPKAYVLGSNKLFVYRNGKKLEYINDYTEDTSTQFTVTAPAVLGDVYDIIVFQGAPPITGLALANLTDVTGDLANAIKDVSLLRTALATATNPLATIADAVAEAAAAVAAVTPAFQEAIRTTDFTPSTLAAPGVAAVPGLSLLVPVVIGRPIQIGFRGLAYFSSGTAFTIGADILIDGVRLSTIKGLTNYLMAFSHDTLNSNINLGFVAWHVPAATGNIVVEAAMGITGGAGSNYLLSPSDLWVFRPRG